VRDPPPPAPPAGKGGRRHHNTTEAFSCEWSLLALMRRLMGLSRRLSTADRRGETWASISRIVRLSPSTTKLQLRLDSEPTDAPFDFSPGQWVDFYIPAIDRVGGYSITSLPSELPLLDLAVKASAHPPAAWCTSRAKVGDRVALRTGGDFVLNEAHEAALFVAGGVGITPLFSMLRTILSSAKEQHAPAKKRTALLYTARTHEELLFKSELEALASSLPLDRARFWFGASRDANAPEVLQASLSASEALTGRIGEPELEAALRWLGCEPNAVRAGRRGVPWMASEIAKRKAREPGTASCGCGAALGAYVCGPQRMTEEMVAALRRMGVVNVYSESWW
jgi:ferredoxin-NADP reductase